MGKIVKAKPIHVTQLLRDGLRSQDRNEIEALGRDPQVALTEGFETSQPHCYSILIGKDPVGMFGVVATEDPKIGIVWMLGSDRLLESKRELVIEARRWVIYLNSIYPTLINAVDVRNTVSIAWLEVMGFTLGPEVPLPNGAVFRSFSRCVNPQA